MAASTVGCPNCKRPVEVGTPYRPFCSERCKMVDLGRWFRGEYVLAGEDAIAIDPEEFEEHLSRLEQADRERPDDEEDEAERDA